MDGERIVEVAPQLARAPGEELIEANGGALIPGLHDHHIHLRALAAAERSVRCGPPDVTSTHQLANVLASARQVGGWIRGIGYHESVAGELDRWKLDRIAGNVPVRIQHRSGMLWIVNSRGVEMLGLDTVHSDAATVVGDTTEAGIPPRRASSSASASTNENESRRIFAVPRRPPGVEYDAEGRATGRLFRSDAWLHERLGTSIEPDWPTISRRLASYGIVAVTDATVSNGPAEMSAFEDAVARGEIAQRIVVMGGASLPRPHVARVERGPIKVVLDEHDLPEQEVLIDTIRSAHADGRTAAVHCVTRTSLLFALDAFAQAGTIPGDRIEHASVAPPEAVSTMARFGLTVVTQPHFIRERGDAYARDVDRCDLPWLYRLRGFVAAGVRLAAGSDAPLGHPDPWLAMRAAIDRRSSSGTRIAPDEALTPEEALALFMPGAIDPSAPQRAIAPGRPAELCLLDRPWSEARRRPSSEFVRATWPAPP